MKDTSMTAADSESPAVETGKPKFGEKLLKKFGWKQGLLIVVSIKAELWRTFSLGVVVNQVMELAKQTKESSIQSRLHSNSTKQAYVPDCSPVHFQFKSPALSCVSGRFQLVGRVHSELVGAFVQSHGQEDRQSHSKADQRSRSEAGGREGWETFSHSWYFPKTQST